MGRAGFIVSAVVMISVALVLLLLQQQHPNVHFDSLKQKASYAYGVDSARNLAQNLYDYDARIVSEAIQDSFQQRVLIPEKELKQAVIDYRKQLNETLKAQSDRFMEDNRKNADVITTASGLQFKVLKKGEGKQPQFNDTVVIQYTGTLISGDTFDSSEKRGEPGTFHLEDMIKGWREGILKMEVGAKYRFFIPYPLAYGDRGLSPRIPPYSVLIFDTELLEVKESQPGAVRKARKTKLVNLKQKASYAMGIRIGKGVQKNFFPYDPRIIAQAVRETLEGRQRPDVEDLNEALSSYHENILTRLKNEADHYLMANRKKPGIKVTTSGLQYQVLKKGQGKKPKLTDTVVVHYRGMLTDGTEFDSSYANGKPSSLALEQMIKGWQEGIPKMRVGASYRFYIPYQLGYGPKGRPPQIPPYSVLVFETELLGMDEGVAEKTP